MYTHAHAIIVREMYVYVLGILTIIATRVVREETICEHIVECHLPFLPVVGLLKNRYYTQ